MKKLDKFFMNTFVAALISLSVITGVPQVRAETTNSTESTIATTPNEVQ